MSYAEVELEKASQVANAAEKCAAFRMFNLQLENISFMSVMYRFCTLNVYCKKVVCLCLCLPFSRDHVYCDISAASKG